MVIKLNVRLDPSVTGNNKDTYRQFNLHYFPNDGSITVIEMRTINTGGKPKVVVSTTIPRQPGIDPETGNPYNVLGWDEGATVRIQSLDQDFAFVIKSFGHDLEQYKYDLTHPPPSTEPVKPPSPPPPPVKSEFELLMEKIRAKIRSRSHAEEGKPISINKLGRHFRICDDSGDGALNRHELIKALTEYQLNLTKEELELVITNLDRDGNESVDYEEFLRAVRGRMNEKRRALVEKAFKKLDASKNGFIELDDIRYFYNAKAHPAVLAGDKTEDEVLGEYLSNYDAIRKDGTVTYKEFEEYYAGVSVSIDHDDHFALLMYNAWKVEPDL